MVLAFASLDIQNDQSDNFKIPAGLATTLGLQSGRTYNVKNIAAYLRPPAVTGRRDTWLWGSGITGGDLQNNGFMVYMKKVPTTPAGWDTAPYEAQYLKLYDVTAPAATPGQPDKPNVYAYAVGTDVTFDWADVGADAGGVVPSYEVTVTINGNPAGSYITTDSQYTVSANVGDQVSIVVRAVNPDAHDNKGPASPSSETVKLLAADGDEDGDGQSNAKEDAAGTNPLDNTSKFVTTAIAVNGNDYEVSFTTVAGKFYHLETSTDLGLTDPWTPVASNNQATGTTMTLTHANAVPPCLDPNLHSKWMAK